MMRLPLDFGCRATEGTCVQAEIQRLEQNAYLAWGRFSLSEFVLIGSSRMMSPMKYKVNDLSNPFEMSINYFWGFAASLWYFLCKNGVLYWSKPFLGLCKSQLNEISLRCAVCGWEFVVFPPLHSSPQHAVPSAKQPNDVLNVCNHFGRLGCSEVLLLCQ